MAIELNPNRLNRPSAKPGSAGRQQRKTGDDAPVVVPKRSPVNYIPAPESLRTLVASAVAALRKGVYWDRGTILNLVV